MADKSYFSLRTLFIVIAIFFIIEFAVCYYVIYGKMGSSPAVDHNLLEIKTEMAEVKEAVNNFKNEVAQSETKVIKETTIIREKVAAQARVMPPDALIAGIEYELNLFLQRGTSGDKTSAYSTELDIR